MALAVREDVLERLAAGVTDLADSAIWQQWLRMQSRFHRYSFANCLLIGMQRPEATLVAGFNRWRELGRFVRKGEKGIRILAPCRYKVENADGEDGWEIRGFKLVSVFDVTQTDGEPLPEIPVHRLHGDDLGLFAALRSYIEGLGYSVELGRFSEPNKNGETNYLTRTVTIRSDLSYAQMAKTAAHEAAHCLLHESFTDRPLAELQAESVAFVVLDAFGIDAGAYSFGYLASWQGDRAAEHIKASGQCIAKTANTILEALGSAGGTP